MKKVLTYVVTFLVLEVLILSIFKPEDYFNKTLGVALITLYLLGLREIKYLSSNADKSARYYFLFSAIAFVVAAVHLGATGSTSYVAMCVLLGIIFFSVFVHMRYSLISTLIAGSLAFFFNFLTIEIFLKDLLIGLMITLIAAGFKFFITTEWKIPKDNKPTLF